MIWIAVDAMGGDDAPSHLVDGALDAVRDVDLGVVLVGPAARIDEELRRHAASIAAASVSSTRLTW
jgi:glycerol-3-phosphate acyltransferase PlsX